MTSPQAAMTPSRLGRHRESLAAAIPGATIEIVV
jgi:hypothetical protein